MNELIQLDHYLFHLLNEEWTNGLFDMIMIKDNHVDYAGGIKEAITSTQTYLKKNMI